MLKALKIVWSIFAISLGTILGAAVGFSSHGIITAVVGGYIGFVVGCVISGHGDASGAASILSIF